MYSGWVSFGGTELVNNSRAAAYAAGVGVRCVCGELAASLGDEPYTSPDQDDAPWFDPAVPESKGFYGCLGLEITGGDAGTGSTEWAELITDGSVPGRYRRAHRDIDVKVSMLAADEVALSYGIAWLASALRGTACSDSNENELCVYSACPERPVHEGRPVDDWEPEQAGDALQRTLFRTALLEGPRVESRTRLSSAVTAEVSFTLRAGVPYWYRNPIGVGRVHLTNLPDTVFTEVVRHDPVSWIARCDEQEPGTCLDEDPYCTAPPFPEEPVPAPADPCFPRGEFTAFRALTQIPVQVAPSWFEAVPIVTVHSGSLPLHRFTMRWYDNPRGDACAAMGLDPCESCAEINLPYLPRNSILTLDGRTRTASVQCPDGSGLVTPRLYGPGGGRFEWPLFDCPVGMCMEMLAESSLARDVQVRVQIASREDAI